ncbi:MAG: hypothetical protein NVS3B21_33620 [Acidimicrobiales bacterium]
MEGEAPGTETVTTPVPRVSISRIGTGRTIAVTVAAAVAATRQTPVVPRHAPFQPVNS